MPRDRWELIGEDVPAAAGIDLQGRHLHILQCPNKHLLVLNSPTREFDAKAIGGSLQCVRCSAHWLAPDEKE